MLIRLASLPVSARCAQVWSEFKQLLGEDASLSYLFTLIDVMEARPHPGMQEGGQEARAEGEREGQAGVGAGRGPQTPSSGGPRPWHPEIGVGTPR